MAKISAPIQLFIEDIMKGGEKLESRIIYERLYNKLEERKSDKRLSYFKGQNFPSKLQLTLFLKTNYKKELNNKQIFLFWK
jgi:hypothetical protein